MDAYLPSIQQTVRFDEATPKYSGGLAELYEPLEAPQSLAKLPTNLTNEWIDKVTSMVSSPLANTSFGGGFADLAWPRGVVETAATPRKVIGVELPNITGRKPLNTLWKSKSISFQDRLLVARNLAWAVEEVHRAGHAVGDLTPSNVLVGANTCVSIVDCDSFHFVSAERVFRCGCGRPIYLAPELLALPSWETADRTPDQDAWALAVITFQLLMRSHPMAAHYTGTGTRMGLAERIRQGVYVYSGQSFPNYEPSLQVSPIEILHDDLRKLVDRMFMDGHSLPAARPLPGEWRSVLASVAADRKYLRRVEKTLADYHDRLRRMHNRAPNQTAPSGSHRNVRSKRRVTRGLIAAGLAAIATISAFVTFDKPVSPSSASQEEADVRQPKMPPPPPVTYTPEEYGVGKPTPRLWKQLADED